MKIKYYLRYLAGTLLFVLSYQAMPQDISNAEKIRLLDEKRQEIDRLAQDNELLKEQISTLEATITDYRGQLEILEQKIQEEKEAAGDTGDNS